jgi:rubrerythrin
LSSEKEILDFIREQIKIENEIMDSLNKALTEMVNPAVKGTLKGISLDSAKHAEIYSAALDLLTSVPQALTEEQLDKQERLVEKHITIEARLIERISETVTNIKDEKIKLLLNAILSDEKRHHALLKEVLAILVKGEAITDEEWFDVVWKGVPFHGAPGG